MMMEIVAVVVGVALAVWMLRGKKATPRPTDQQKIAAREREKRQRALTKTNKHVAPRDFDTWHDWR